MAENLVRLDLGRFTATDVSKILGLQSKLRLMHRWFRHERVTADGTDAITVYSGDRGPTPYASYRFVRHRDGQYELVNARTRASLARGRTVDTVLRALPDDFYYAR
ncbi:MAG: hypothetical protein AB7F67_05580 [Rhodospirillaceae bacterium]